MMLIYTMYPGPSKNGGLVEINGLNEQATRSFTKDHTKNDVLSRSMIDYSDDTTMRRDKAQTR